MIYKMVYHTVSMALAGRELIPEVGIGLRGQRGERTGRRSCQEQTLMLARDFFGKTVRPVPGMTGWSPLRGRERLSGNSNRKGKRSGRTVSRIKPRDRVWRARKGRCAPKGYGKKYGKEYGKGYRKGTAPFRSGLIRENTSAYGSHLSEGRKRPRDGMIHALQKSRNRLGYSSPGALMRMRAGELPGAGC